jgi:hypothetical protein
MSNPHNRNPTIKQRIGLAESLAKQVTVFADRAEVRRSLTLDLVEGTMMKGGVLSELCVASLLC